MIRDWLKLKRLERKLVLLEKQHKAFQKTDKYKKLSAEEKHEEDLSYFQIDYSLVWEEIEEIKTKKLLSKLVKYKIPFPHRWEKNGKEYWKDGQYGSHFLTTKGYHILRNTLREEENARRDTITRKVKLFEIPTLIVAGGTFLLAFVAFSRFTIENRPNVFISEVSPKSTSQYIIYTLDNSSAATAYDIDIIFHADLTLLDENKKVVRKVPMELTTERIEHLYAKQQKISILSWKLKDKAKEESAYYKINIRYAINYTGKLLFIPIAYLEKGSIGLNSETGIWLLLPE